jgi:UDP-N-acetylbacillosamine N-acetyltransferase
MEPRRAEEQIPLVIWGASGHARVVADAVRLLGIYSIVGFIDDVNPERKGTSFCGARVLGGQEELRSLRDSGVRHVLLGFGDCQARLRRSELIREMGFQMPTIIHPRTVVARDVEIGDGTVVMAGAVINACARVGDNAIINTLASVDHDCVIGDGVHIGPGAHLGGGASVGRASWIGIGAILKDRVRIGDSVIIGAGAVVLKDIPDGVTAFGVPARVITQQERG